MFLLCTDLHLDDQRANEYRWHVFDEIRSVCETRPISCVFCFGDMTEKRDRFSREIVNRLVRSWLSLVLRVSEENSAYMECPRRDVVILMGNHDGPATGDPAFWAFLNEIDGIEYVTRPTARDDLILLPFSANPKVEWSGLDFRSYSAAFMHATPKGALAENGFVLDGSDLPALPRSLKIYSGDVHTPQRVRNWTLIGAPHPVKFGEDHPYRFLLLDERSYDIVEEIRLDPIGKRVVEISTLDDLKSLARVRRGDQVQIRVTPDAPGVLDWGALETAVDAWARETGAEVMSIAGGYELPAQTDTLGAEKSPEELLRAFAAEEGVSGDLLDVGMALLREARE